MHNVSINSLTIYGLSSNTYYQIRLEFEYDNLAGLRTTHNVGCLYERTAMPSGGGFYFEDQ